MARVIIANQEGKISIKITRGIKARGKYKKSEGVVLGARIKPQVRSPPAICLNCWPFRNISLDERLKQM